MNGSVVAAAATPASMYGSVVAAAYHLGLKASSSGESSQASPTDSSGSLKSSSAESHLAHDSNSERSDTSPVAANAAWLLTEHELGLQTSIADVARSAVKPFTNGAGSTPVAATVVSNGVAPTTNGTCGDSFRCSDCGILLLNQHYYRLHMEDAHSSSPKQPAIVRFPSQPATNGVSSDLHLTTDDDCTSRCAECAATFRSESQLKLHMLDVHRASFDRSLASAARLLNGAQTTPADHRCLFCGSAWPTEDALRMHLVDGHMQESAAVLSMMQLQQPVSSSSPPTTKIFNPEAYCEICNKEFCNKYFLKTHKANKHGIAGSSEEQPYTGDQTSPSSGDASGDYLHRQMSALLAKQSDGDFSPHTADGTLAEQPQNLSFRSRHNGVGSVGSGDSARSSGSPLHLPTELFDFSHFQAGSGAASSLLASQLEAADLASAFLAVDNKLRQPMPPSMLLPFTDSSMMCPLCRQPFPNQLLLQSHMITVHGSGGTTFSSPFNLQQALYTSMLGAATGNPAAIIQANLLVERMKLIGATNPLAAAALFGLAPSATQVENGFEGAPVSPPDRGMVEAGAHAAKDAFCEICRKQFCNKYFLRTHKLNKHGIVSAEEFGSPAGKSKLDDELRSPIRQQLSESAMDEAAALADADDEQQRIELALRNEFRFMREQPSALKRQYSASEAFRTAQTPPPSKLPKLEPLTMSATSPPSLTPDYGVRQQQQQLRRSSFGPSSSSTSPSSQTCNVCMRAFPSTFALVAHKYQEHSITSADGTNLPKSSLSQSDSLLSLSASQKSPASEAAAAAAQQQYQQGVDPDAYCEICKKEFCSKYFLRTHKLNIHGIAIDSSPSQVGLSGSLLGGGTNTQKFGNVCAGRSPFVNSKNFCEICNKELCNKYFLRTHMLKMHQIVVDENRSLVGVGVADKDKSPNVTVSSTGGQLFRCGECGKEFPSRHFLRVHRVNCHNSGASADECRCPALPPNVTITPAVNSPPPVVPQTETGADEQAEVVPAKAVHQPRPFSQTCGVCQRRFKSRKWLRTHMWNEHKTIPEMFDVLNAAALQVAAAPPEDGHEAAPCEQADETKVEPAEKQEPTEVSTVTTLMSEVDEDDLLNTSCDFCGETFQTLTDLQLHVFAQHANESTSSLRRQRSQQGGLRKASAIESVIASIVAAQSLSRNFADVQQEPVGDGARDEAPVVADEQASRTESPTAAAGADSSALFAPQRRVGKPRSTGKGATKMYYCSFCTYSTRWLSNLYVHERRHTGDAAGDEAREYVCDVCLKAYRYQHSLDRHMECHRYGKLNFLHLQQLKQQQQPPVVADDLTSEPQQLPLTPQKAETTPSVATPLSVSKGDTPSKSAKSYACSKCSKQYRTRELCRMHIIVAHAPSPSRRRTDAATPIAMSPKKVYRCRLCGFSSRAYVDLRTHLAGDHGIAPKTAAPPAVEGEKAPSPIPEDDEHKQRDTTEVPSAPSSTYRMQSFVIRERGETGLFAPSVVFLPVLHAVTEALEATFVLAPWQATSDEPASPRTVSRPSLSTT